MLLEGLWENYILHFKLIAVNFFDIMQEWNLNFVTSVTLKLKVTTPYSIGFLRGL